jgi:hypothetical protein
MPFFGFLMNSYMFTIPDLHPKNNILISKVLKFWKITKNYVRDVLSGRNSGRAGHGARRAILGWRLPEPEVSALSGDFPSRGAAFLTFTKLRVFRPPPAIEGEVALIGRRNLARRNVGRTRRRLDGEYGFVSDDYEVVSLEYPSSLPYMMRDD